MVAHSPQPGPDSWYILSKYAFPCVITLCHFLSCCNLCFKTSLGAQPSSSSNTNSFTFNSDWEYVSNTREHGESSFFLPLERHEIQSKTFHTAWRRSTVNHAVSLTGCYFHAGVLFSRLLSLWTPAANRNNNQSDFGKATSPLRNSLGPVLSITLVGEKIGARIGISLY